MINLKKIKKARKEFIGFRTKEQRCAIDIFEEASIDLKDKKFNDEFSTWLRSKGFKPQDATIKQYLLYKSWLAGRERFQPCPVHEKETVGITIEKLNCQIDQNGQEPLYHIGLSVDFMIPKRKVRQIINDLNAKITVDDLISLLKESK